jgi:hypothetical protein
LHLELQQRLEIMKQLSRHILELNQRPSHEWIGS